MPHTNNPEVIAKFKSRNPYLLMQIGEYRLYECPKHGDIAPILMLTPNETLVSTGFYDLGDFEFDGLDLCHTLDPEFEPYTPFAHNNDI